MDCMEYMKGIPNKFFDLAVVDPEYGIGIAKRNGSIGQKKGQGKITRYKSKDWDSKPPDKEYFDELFRVSKNQIIFGANYFSRWIPPSIGLFMISCSRMALRLPWLNLHTPPLI